MSSLSKPLRIGRYVLCDKIASGGMASVYFARQGGPSGFAKTVAVKRLHPQLARMPDFRTMILEEARLAARIRHPNVVPPLDVLAEAQELLLVMEYVHGESFSKLLKAAWAKGETVPLTVAAAVMANMCHGLHAAHEAKDEAGDPLDIVHRDVSPQNVIVGVDGVARVIDFGIAKAVTTAESTSAGTVKGKVPYLAPEQLEGESTTRRTDLFSASVVFWEALAGRRLFKGSDDAEILRLILEMPIPPPSAYNPTVPEALDEIVLQGLARDPGERFATAREIALAIETSTPLATATQVGAWTERLAAEALGVRAQKLALVESLSLESSALRATLDRQELSPVSFSPASEPTPSDHGGNVAIARADAHARPVTEVLGPDLPTIGPRGRRGDAGGPLGSAPPASLNDQTFAGLSAALRAPELRPTPAEFRPPPKTVHLPESPARAHVREVAWLSPPPPTGEAPSSLARKLLYAALGGLFFLAVTLALFSPYIAAREVRARAADLGIALTLDRVEVSRRQLRIVDVHAESRELPGVAAHASAIVVGLRGLSPASIVVEDMQVTIDGSASEITARFARWRASHAARLHESSARLEQLSVASAKIEWQHVGGAGTSATLENVVFDMDKLGTRAFGDDFRSEAPIVTVTSGLATAGPWKLEIDRTGILTRAVLHLDPSGSYPSSVTWTKAEDGSTGLNFAVPSTPLAALHVPPELFGTIVTSKTRLEAKGELSIVASTQAGAAARGGRSVSGRLTLGGANLALIAGQFPVDLSLDMPVSGDLAAPVPVAAALAVSSSEPVGPPFATAKLTGKVDLVETVRVELSGRTTPVPCAKGGGDVSFAVNVAVSEGSLRQSKLSFEPSRACPVKIR